MIRKNTEDAWVLVPHREHARVAGEFARHWKNADFLPPEPFAHILDAVARHDDSWATRDSAPELTPEGRPSAFSSELVGGYDAFEEIDLEAYLGVREKATDVAAERDPYAAVLISMHTVNLLTEQADLSGLGEQDRATHARFVEGQRRRQAALKAEIRKAPDLVPFATDAHFDAAFRFLQACDSLSLYLCVGFDRPGQLRHPQRLRSGGSREIALAPVGPDHYTLDPWPLDEPAVDLCITHRRVPKTATASLDAFRESYAGAPDEILTAHLTQPAT